MLLGVNGLFDSNMRSVCRLSLVCVPLHFRAGVAVACKVLVIRSVIALVIGSNASVRALCVGTYATFRVIYLVTIGRLCSDLRLTLNLRLSGLLLESDCIWLLLTIRIVIRLAMVISRLVSYPATLAARGIVTALVQVSIMAPDGNGPGSLVRTAVT